MLVLGAGLALAFAFLASHYYFLGDDCYISFRYARNLVEGHGLVYNPDERVEGYTNYLWVLISAAVMLLEMDPGIAANAIGIASGAVILAALLHMGARSSRWSDPLIWIAPACLAVNRTFTAWCTGGLATQFFSMLVLVAYLAFMRERRRSLAKPTLSALLFAVATLTRPEGALFTALAGCFFAYEALVSRRRRLGGLALWASIYLLIVGAHVAWRYSYYGYLLPNTFYAKVSGFWWDQSRIWMALFLRDYHLVWASPLLVILFVLRREFGAVLFASVVAAYSAYLIYIGGDHFEFRFITPMLPYLYWLLQEAVRAMVAWCRSRRLPAGLAASLGPVLGLLLVLSSCLPNATGFQGMRYGIIDIELFKRYTDSRVEQGRFLRRLVEQGHLTGKEVLAVGGAGALPYFSRLYTVDFRGLNDRYVAHLPPERRTWIGHQKMAPYDYLVERGVVIWDVDNRIVWEPGHPKPGPYTVQRDFYQGPVCFVEAEGRYLAFATTLEEDEFRRVFSNFNIVSLDCLRR